MILYRFLYEALYIVSYRFLREATGDYKVLIELLTKTSGYVILCKLLFWFDKEFFSLVKLYQFP